MEEFIRLYLTGKRAENMARFRRMRTIFGLIGAFFTLIPVFLTIAADNLPLTVAFSALGALFSVAEAGLNYYEAAYLRGLVELQNEANEIELRGEERIRSEKLYAAWMETLGKRSLFRPISAVLSGGSYLLLAASAVVCAACSLPSAVLLVACFAFCILICTASVMRVMGEGRGRTALYERAEREIEEIKRQKFGLPEARIASESENARAFSSVPLSVMMFLKEDTERAEFQIVAKRSGVAAFLIGLAIGVAFILSTIGELWEKLGPTLSWLLAGAFFALLFAVFFAFLFPLERRKKEIYKRNFQKLGEGETDALRKQLQAAWIRLQKAGNIMFFIALMAPILAGTALGFIGYFTVEGVVLADAIGGSIMCLLIPAAILSVIIWIVMFAVYRKRVRPTEILLKEKCSEEGK